MSQFSSDPQSQLSMFVRSLECNQKEIFIQLSPSLLDSALVMSQKRFHLVSHITDQTLVKFRGLLWKQSLNAFAFHFHHNFKTATADSEWEHWQALTLRLWPITTQNAQMNFPFQLNLNSEINDRKIISLASTATLNTHYLSKLRSHRINSTLDKRIVVAKVQMLNLQSPKVKSSSGRRWVNPLSQTRGESNKLITWFITFEFSLGRFRVVLVCVVQFHFVPVLATERCCGRPTRKSKTIKHHVKCAISVKGLI